VKISEQWLREWVSPDLKTDALAHQLTMAGLEVDAIEPVAIAFSGVVVAEIIDVAPHPDAAKLRVCRISTGAESLQVVCGAPNARVGLKVPLARVGAILPGDIVIKRASLRGVDSEGMLCAARELGLPDSSDGLLELPIDAPTGAELREYLDLDDNIIDISVTPNRADCLGIEGIAREVGLLNKLSVQGPAFTKVDVAVDDIFPITVQASDCCPRYIGRVIRGVDVTRPSPRWLQEKLRRCGIRSIDAVVDVTNYLLLELGQPMHAFDLGNLSGGIVVRKARQGEPIELLDGQTLSLRDDTLVIADHSRPLAMAGIMGGKHSAVSGSTTDVFLESAYFTPELLAGKARSYGLHTDSSHRFERGVDFQLQERAIERATQILIDIVGGLAGPLQEVVSHKDLPERPDVVLRADRIEKTLGFGISPNEVEQILSGLGLGVTSIANGWRCAVPSWRFDIALEVDLLEELARIYGYNRLPVTHIRAELEIPARPETSLSQRYLRRHLCARGYHEAITYSFVDPLHQRLFDPGYSPVSLRNPISAEMAVMRTSLLPGLISAAMHNLNRQQSRVRLFETGLRFLPDSTSLCQVPMLAMVCTGQRFAKSWAAAPALALDFYDLKGDLESLFKLTGAPEEYAFDATAHSALHPGQAAVITRKGQAVGIIGALHPGVAAGFGLDTPMFVAEVELSAVLEGVLPSFTEVSKFPEVRRDLAIIVDKSVPASHLIDAVKSAAGTYLTDLTLFDVYTGKGIDPKRKSVALGLTFRGQSRTLGEEDIHLAVGQVIDLLEKKYNAELRN